MTADEFFLYVYCDELVEMRRGYSDLVGIEEIVGPDDAHGIVAYRHGNVQFTLFSKSKVGAENEAIAGAIAGAGIEAKAGEESSTDGWHRQPGWSGGTIEGTSWSIQVQSESHFRSAVDRLLTSEVRQFHDVPNWVGYWSFPVKDPEGNTVEITFSPPSPPKDTAWETW